MKEVKTPQMMALRTSRKITSFKDCACPWRIGESENRLLRGESIFPKQYVKSIESW